MNSTSLNRPGLQPWQFYLTASFLAAAAAVWMSPPSSPVALLFISLAIGAAGACAAALHGLLAALNGRVSAERHVTESARAALDREKLLALRAIKDLQFDVAMGKVNAADAAAMEARLRERATAIMQQLDGREQLRARVEQDLAQRKAIDHRPEATGQRPSAAGLSPEAYGPEAVTCAACATANDVDARFCKGCGARL